jgi:cyclic pyranopterin phosphate synthase
MKYFGFLLNKLTHLDSQGALRMVNISSKPSLLRIAEAKGTRDVIIPTGEIHMNPNTVQQITNNQLKKGDVLTVAKIAGIYN